VEEGQVQVGILALQGDVREHRLALTELGAATREVRRPDDLIGLEGIVLPGGESTTMSLLLDSSGLMDPLRKQLDAGLPAFGTCAGLILLATEVVDGRPDQQHFGRIDVSARRNGYGRQIRSFEAELDVPALGDTPLHAVFIRAPVVVRAGPDVEVLAELPAAVEEDLADAATPPTEHRPVLCRQGPVLVSAFHPELTGDRRLHGLFLSMIDAAA
jgi:5'-phosphate synthase pdxT subunit